MGKNNLPKKFLALNANFNSLVSML